MESAIHVLALFPGQGSISPGAGRAWRTDDAWRLVDEASALSGVDVAHLLLSAEDDELVRTDNAQIATFVLSLMSYQSFCRTRSTPESFVGHSLGEYSALTAAGMLSFADGVRLVAARGAAMLKASQLQPGAMAALMGGHGDISKVTARGDVWLANVNGFDQLVVAGTEDGIDYLEENVNSLGWKRCRRLKVGGAFHSPLMAPASADLSEALRHVEFRTTPHRVFSNVDGALHSDTAEWPQLCLRQLTEPVQFERCVTNATAEANVAVEFEPTGVLRGLVRRISPNLDVTEFPGGSL